MSTSRFNDKGTYLTQFMDFVSVECPSCQKHSSVICAEYPRNDKPARLICNHCGYSVEISQTSWKGPVSAVVKRRCPNCGLWLEKEIQGAKRQQYIEIKCPGCKTKIDEGVTWQPDAYGKPHDPFFGMPLWFVGRVRDHILWAYNRQHLSFIKKLVEASLRESSAPNQKKTLSNTLPKWMLSSKNRSHVLKTIEKLQTRS
jgi:hypothetical protein